MLRAPAPVANDPSALPNILQAAGIGVEPKSECYVYPPANRFPQNSLIRDSVDYFLHVKGQGKDRHVGILILAPENRLLALVIELTGFKADIAYQINAMLTSEPLGDAEAILRNAAAVALFRQLYTHVAVKFLGFNQQNQQDMAIVQQQLSKLMVNAYHNQIAANFIPLSAQGSLLHDLISVLKPGAAPQLLPQPQAAAAPQVPTIAAEISAMFNMLQTQGIGLEPTSESYVYPPANRFPQNSFIGDNVDYFLAMNKNPKDRRFGITVLTQDHRLLVLIIQLSGVNQEVLQKINDIVASERLESRGAILASKAAVEQFRQLYTQVRCNLLGFNSGIPGDAQVVQQFAQLVSAAYITDEKINFVLVPIEGAVSNLVLLQTLTQIMKQGALMPPEPALPDVAALRVADQVPVPAAQGPVAPSAPIRGFFDVANKADEFATPQNSEDEDDDAEVVLDDKKNLRQK